MNNRMSDFNNIRHITEKEKLVAVIGHELNVLGGLHNGVSYNMYEDIVPIVTKFVDGYQNEQIVELLNDYSGRYYGFPEKNPPENSSDREILVDRILRFIVSPQLDRYDR